MSLKTLILTALLTGSGFSLLAEDTLQDFRRPLPAIGIGTSLFRYRGDIGEKLSGESLRNHFGFRFELQLYRHERFSISANYVSGKITANTFDTGRPLNFESSFFQQGISARYDFNFTDRQQPVVMPFITGGVGLLHFRTFSDLKDASGNYYHYWSDGTIRNLEETPAASATSTILYRDYVYETDVREANLDGFGGYSQQALCFPIEIGLNLQLSEKVAVTLSTGMQLLQTDLLDGITATSRDYRQGDSKNDRLNYSSVMVRYDFGVRSKKTRTEYDQVDFKQLAKEDADRDGVLDLKDMVADTASGAVDKMGRPSDRDQDGIPDYRDDEPETGRSSIVTETGVTLTDQLQEERTNATNAAPVPDKVFLRPFDPLNPDAVHDPSHPLPPQPLPAEFQPVDADLDGFISPPEMTKATNDFSAGKSPLSKQSFYRLIEYFFRQDR